MYRSKRFVSQRRLCIWKSACEPTKSVWRSTHRRDTWSRRDITRSDRLHLQSFPDPQRCAFSTSSSCSCAVVHCRRVSASSAAALKIKRGIQYSGRFINPSVFLLGAWQRQLWWEAATNRSSKYGGLQSRGNAWSNFGPLHQTAPISGTRQRRGQMAGDCPVCVCVCVCVHSTLSVLVRLQLCEFASAMFIFVCPHF